MLDKSDVRHWLSGTVGTSGEERIRVWIEALSKTGTGDEDPTPLDESQAKS